MRFHDGEVLALSFLLNNKRILYMKKFIDCYIDLIILYYGNNHTVLGTGHYLWEGGAGGGGKY